MNQGAPDNYPVVVYPDACTDGSFCYVAYHPDLPGCAAHGMTLGEAKERLVGARLSYIAQLQAEGKLVPLPNAMAPSSIELDSAILDPVAAQEQVA